MNNQSNKRPPDPRDYDMYSAFRTKERGDARRQAQQRQKSSYFDAYAHRAAIPRGLRYPACKTADRTALPTDRGCPIRAVRASKPKYRFPEKLRHSAAPKQAHSLTVPVYRMARMTPTATAITPATVPQTDVFSTDLMRQVVRSTAMHRPPAVRLLCRERNLFPMPPNPSTVRRAVSA